ncbi:hypothetical protein QBC45DRAFT_402148 [Copromyces sp. CBS 386.78]|nr:hypothetical protein QBC45DRAFT_402148 [Copromyces sp. CBS 386.78]
MEEAKNQPVRQSRTQPTSTPMTLPQQSHLGGRNDSHHKRSMLSSSNHSPIGKPVERQKTTQGVKVQSSRRLATQQNISLPPPGDKRPGVVNDACHEGVAGRKENTSTARTPILKPSQLTTKPPNHCKTPVVEPSRSTPSLPVQRPGSKTSQLSSNPPKNEDKPAQGPSRLDPSLPIQVRRLKPTRSILSLSGNKGTRHYNPVRRRKSVTWAASPVLNAIRWIESREELREAEEEEAARRGYRPPYVSEDETSEWGGSCTCSQGKKEEVSQPVPESSEPQAPRRLSNPPVQTSETSPGVSASSGTEYNLAQHQRDSFPAAPVPETSLRRQGAIKVKETGEKMILPKLEGGSFTEEKISTPNHTPEPGAFPSVVPLKGDGVARDEKTLNLKNEDKIPTQGNSNYSSNVNAGSMSHHERQPPGPDDTPRSSSQPEHLSFRERLDIFNRQSDPPARSKRPASEMVEPSTSPPPTFQRTNTCTHQRPSGSNENLTHSVAEAESSVSITSTKTEYSRSAESEVWEQFLETGSPDMFLAAAAPGSGHQYCACSSCVWALTSRAGQE